ncbi:NTP transferase domain-containing protein [Halobaculum sp. WSA2]|uniref:Bifunctional protein GlmU n=1 Tax=Halobaculum saliterrae TaxID=2073113 RepID=A0A6B0SZT9_9EURY|nr:sugar phosphate nucleotidyltransferase [Halobaculum saliterrae]MXR41862.1 NTP transferase domain-containing protein [Halobaculum saliterrae]
MSINSAVVLAAGEGQRLRPLTKYRPKPMLPAANRPILEYVLDALIDAGIDDLHIVVGYEADRVQNHFGPTYRNRTITYHTQEKQLGSGHALLQARDGLDGDFLVVNGDEVVDTETVAAVVDAHSAADVCTLAVVESAEAPLYGAVTLEGSTVSELIEKPGTGAYRLLNAGVYAFGPSFLSTVEAVDRADGELALTDGIADLIDRGGHVRGVRADGLHSEVTYPWDLTALASTLLADGRVNEPEAEPGVYVADSASIAEDAVLYGPIVVGPDAVVEPGAVVGPDAAVGPNVTVESGAVVRRSVVDTDTRVGANATLVDSITGQGVEIGAGATAPGGPADVRVGDRVHEDERLGCVLADRARLGGGATVRPGLLVGPGADIAAGVTLHRSVDEDTEVQG